MPEAEDVITDVARHAAIYARELWRRHGADRPKQGGAALADVAQRLDIFIAAAFGTGFSLRVAQSPAPRTFLAKLFRRSDTPVAQNAVPATDGASIWLPARLPDSPGLSATDCYRVLALREAVRAHRMSAAFADRTGGRLGKAVFIALEAWAADHALLRDFPGAASSLKALREAALRERPALERFPAHHRPMEELVRRLMRDCADMAPPESPQESLALAGKLSAKLSEEFPASLFAGECLFKDLWTGDLFPVPALPQVAAFAEAAHDEPAAEPPRSARLSRRPEVRESSEDEDDDKPGAWMVQTSQPHEQAEDPVGMQRPTDRDEETAADEFADSFSELPEARLVSTPGRPKEVLLSDDAPEMQARRKISAAVSATADALHYPEWDFRSTSYRHPGARVQVGQAARGEQEWVDRTLTEYRAMVQAVRRQFETLRAQRVRHRRQMDGEEIDLEAYVESRADFRAGMPLAQALYQQFKPARRELAVMLLIDISGSTDAWVSSNKRIIDVEREALLLVSVAMQAMSAPFAIQGFSGEGPQGVVVRTVKSFEETYGNDIALRIAALEPEHYTRAGAALRHASTELMRQPARHRLLILLSDGKPNDVDEYEGRYGVEDMRQAVTEAKLQGIHPFCLTIDRHAAAYLSKIFGAHQYALLTRPALLPTVLVDWMKRLVAS